LGAGPARKRSYSEFYRMPNYSVQETTYGEAYHNQNPPELDSGNGTLLCHQEKRSDDDRKNDRAQI
jgi:hypothetical protein